MCGQFYVEPEYDDEELRAILDEVNRRSRGAAAVGTVCPGSTVAAVANGRDGALHPFPMKWGYAQSGSRPVINARSETAGVKPMFRDSMRLRRCLIPATKYFEWQKLENGKRKFSIRPQGERVMYMAGLYRLEQGAPYASCVILTRPASESVAAIHDRMPVILPGALRERWLAPDADAAAVMANALEAMLAEPSA